MSITDELREYAGSFYLFRYKDVREKLDAIADRIDAEYERQLEVLYRDMSDAEYIKLPVDADGEPIHVGDELEDVDNPSSHGEVHRIELTRDACWVFVNGFGRTSNHYRHYHAPTVEDVLREMLYKAHIYDEREMELLPDLIAEYAAKLRLMEDA